MTYQIMTGWPAHQNHFATTTVLHDRKAKLGQELCWNEDFGQSLRRTKGFLKRKMEQDWIIHFVIVEVQNEAKAEFQFSDFYLDNHLFLITFSAETSQMDS